MSRPFCAGASLTKTILSAGHYDRGHSVRGRGDSDRPPFSRIRQHISGLSESFHTIVSSEAAIDVQSGVVGEYDRVQTMACNFVF